jgi:hypothetical protein
MRLTQRVRAGIEKDKDDLIGLAHDIHVHPQLAYEENDAAGWISEYLERRGFEVQLGVYDMPTAFAATYGDGPLHLVFCAEHDALPPDALSDRMPAEFAEVIPVQTEKPAGRLAPGKTLFVHAGAFRNVHAALMAHPFPTPYGAFIPTHTYGRLLAEFSRSSGATRGQLDAAALRALETALSTAISDLHQSLLQCRTKPEDADSGAVNHTECRAAARREPLNRGETGGVSTRSGAPGPES